MKNIDKLKLAKQEYDDLEAIRIKANDLFENEKYDVCVHFHYADKIAVSMSKINIEYELPWARFDLIDGEVNVVDRRNYDEREIEEMLIFIEEWMSK